MQQTIKKKYIYLICASVLFLSCSILILSRVPPHTDHRINASAPPLRRRTTPIQPNGRNISSSLLPSPKLATTQNEAQNIGWDVSLTYSIPGDELYGGRSYIKPDETPCHFRGINYDGIPIAKTVEESKRYFEVRLRRVIRCWLERPLNPFPNEPSGRGRFTNPANARLIARSDIKGVNDIILRNDTDQWGLYGSTMLGFKYFCGRTGDYDFTTQALIRTAYIDLFDPNILQREAREKLKWSLLTVHGVDHFLEFPVCGLVNHHETENHILMIETSRYLTNQLIARDHEFDDEARLEFDNSMNNFNEWMLHHLQQFFIDYFEEYNSKPYQAYTVLTICNLYAYAEDPKVKVASHMLMDLLSAVFAVQSNGLRRMSPFRRQAKYAESHVAYEKDGETARMALLAGNYEYLRGDDRPFKRWSAQHGGEGGVAFSDHRMLPDHPLLAKVEVQVTTRVNRIILTMRDGTILANGPYKFWGQTYSIDLDWDEYLNTMIVHTADDKVSYIEFHTTNGTILAAGTQTEQQHNITASDGWHITGLTGKSSTDIDKLGAIFTPIDYMYENDNYKLPYGMGKMLNAAIVGYRVPDVLLDLMIRKDHNTYFQKIKHDGVEIYSSSKSFLLSAGGVFNYNFMFGSNEQHGWARPTTIMPSKDPSSDYKNWIRIEGNEDRTKRYNHCVAENFACGLNIVIPPTIPRSCIERFDNWHFVDFNAPACPLDYGFHVAIYIKEIDSNRCRGLKSNFGFFEVGEADALPYEHFKNKVLKNNGHVNYSCGIINSYTKTDGQTIAFESYNPEKWLWPIVSIDDVLQERDIEEWGFAEGDVIKAKRDGRIVIENRYLRKRLILDMSNPLNPKRIEQTMAV